MDFEQETENITREEDELFCERALEESLDLEEGADLEDLPL